MTLKRGMLIACLVAVTHACRVPTSPSQVLDPDLAGTYRGNLSIVITDTTLFLGSRRVLLSVDCPLELILTRLQARTYALTMHTDAAHCSNKVATVDSFLSLAPTATGIVHVDSVVGPATLEPVSLGHVAFGSGTPGDLQALIGCLPHNADAGWRAFFQALDGKQLIADLYGYLRPDVDTSLGSTFAAECGGHQSLFVDVQFGVRRLP